MNVAAGDVNGDGRADIFTGTPPARGEVKVFSRRDLSLLGDFFPFGGTFTGGVYVV